MIQLTLITSIFIIVGFILFMVLYTKIVKDVIAIRSLAILDEEYSKALPDNYIISELRSIVDLFSEFDFNSHFKFEYKAFRLLMSNQDFRFNLDKTCDLLGILYKYEPAVNDIYTIITFYYYPSEMNNDKEITDINE